MPTSTLSVEARLSIVSILLFFQLVSFATEFLGLSAYDRLRGFAYTPTSRNFLWFIGRWGISLLLFLLVFIFYVPFTVWLTRIKLDDTGIDCSINVDGDIAGPGIIIATWIQIGISFFLSFFGLFHTNALGIKEAGAGLILTNISATIALLVRLAPGLLKPPDAIIGFMIIDAQSAALSIQLTSKETLSTISQVFTVVLSQAFSLVATTITVRGFTKNWWLDNDGCRCVTVVWWAELSNCDFESKVLEEAVLWIYLACRFLGFFQMSLHAVYNAPGFDRAARSGPIFGHMSRYGFARMPRYVLRVDRMRYPHYNGNLEARYSEYPGTVSLMGAYYGALALMSLTSAALTTEQLDIKPSSDVNSTGQIIALVIAGATIIRVLFLISHLLMHEKSLERFSWPCLSGRRSGTKQWWGPQDLTRWQYHIDPNQLPLGSLLEDENEPRNSRFEHVVAFQDSEVQKISRHGWKEGAYHDPVRGLPFPLLWLCCYWLSSRTRYDIYKAEMLTTEIVDVERIRVEQLYDLQEIRQRFTPGVEFVSFYMVIGRMVASGFQVEGFQIVDPAQNILYAYQTQQFVLFRNALPQN